MRPGSQQTRALTMPLSSWDIPNISVTPTGQPKYPSLTQALERFTPVRLLCPHSPIKVGQQEIKVGPNVTHSLTISD